MSLLKFLLAPVTIAAICTLGIFAAVIFIAVVQQNHDAVVALIGLAAPASAVGVTITRNMSNAEKVEENTNPTPIVPTTPNAVVTEPPITTTPA